MLDAIYAHLYGLSREDVAYLLGTFDVLQKNELKRYGEYRTARLCLDAYDRRAGIAGRAGTARGGTR